jgi:sulfide:quinone oxidoreductase
VVVALGAEYDVSATPGLAEGGWIPVNRATLQTRFPDVFAIGDVTSVGTPRAGTFAEGAGKVVAAGIAARARGGAVAPCEGDGHCYIEFGEEQIAEIYVNFLGGPKPWTRVSAVALAPGCGRCRVNCARR